MSIERPPLLRATRASSQRHSAKIAGVASGLSTHLGIPVSWVRTAFLVGIPLAASGPLLYAWLWATVPADQNLGSTQETHFPAAQPLVAPLHDTRTRRPPIRRQLLALGVSALSLALLLWLVPLVTIVQWQSVMWLILIVTGLILMWAQIPKLFAPANGAAISRTVLGAALAVFATSLFLDTLGPPGLPIHWITKSLIVAAGLLIALIPIGLRALGEISASRTAAARETERAEIAAHLHDSVLQTLTLVRAAADDPVRVRALALRQESELRSWLYTGQAEPAQSLAQALRAEAAEVETMYGIPIEAVTVGDAAPSPSNMAAIAAAAEAMKNAARHGKPPISVYQEVTAHKLEIFVKDSGDGFDPDQVPEDRHGYRNSIVGRVERAGGTVRMRQRNGTEIEITVPHQKEGDRS